MRAERRQRLDELVIRYKFSPKLRDIYVEGSSDKNLLEWFLREKGQRDFSIYEIDTVEIPAEKLQELGVSNNNKGRIIALAFELERRLSPLHLDLTCIADRDFDVLFDKEYECEFLLFTDYSSMEMYLWDESILNKFLTLGLGTSGVSAEGVLSKLAPVLEEVFLIRAANEALELKMEWLDFTKSCSSSKYEIVFKDDEFIDKYLNKNSQRANKQRFVEKIQQLRSVDIRETRSKIRGHDFINLLCWCMKKELSKKKRELDKPENMTGYLWLAAGADRLAQEGLFRRLLSRLSE
ncbi:MAG: hypothetical protein F6J93_19305 [Oscillatoria sp. SIO1A7]|nr:hypothetical protein [Oscillatoria sp. SIO1A7]